MGWVRFRGTVRVGFRGTVRVGFRVRVRVRLKVRVSVLDPSSVTLSCPVLNHNLWPPTRVRARVRVTGGHCPQSQSLGVG